MRLWFPLLFTTSIALAQQTVTKPVLSATPATVTTAPASQDPDVTRTVVQTTAQTSDAKPASTTPIDTQTESKIPAVQSSTPPPASSASYIIGPEDSLQITVWKEPGFSGTLPVRPDGMISLALVGDLPAAGFSPMRLSQDIATRLKKYINDPSVNVTVLAVHPKQVYLLGEVAHIGALAITPDMTPLQAISAAGGLTPYANAKHIYILRGEQGKQKKISFDYKKAIKDGNQQGVTLMPDDTIVIP